jgi:predicted lipid-binding transport protein (Tim44 family)
MRNSVKASALGGLIAGLLLGYLIMSFILGGSVIISFILGAALGAGITYLICFILGKKRK